MKLLSSMTQYATCLLFLFTAPSPNYAEDKPPEYVFISRGTITLKIPGRYIAEMAPAAQQDSILIRVPDSELGAILPNNSLPAGNFTTLIHVLNDRDIENMKTYAIETIDDINSGQGSYRNATYSVDEKSKFINVNRPYSDILGWTVIKHFPPIVENDIIASCFKQQLASITQCKLSTITVDGVGIDTSVRVEHLKYYEIIRDHIALLIRGWRV